MKRRTRKEPKPSRSIATGDIVCAHCTVFQPHTIIYCGNYRICAVCQCCRNHTRLAQRHPTTRRQK
jgi:hypothetical protein